MGYAQGMALTSQRGRPSSFKQVTADAICERLTEGESLRTICLDADMPATRTVFQWLAADPSFAQQYARAREIQGHVVAEMAVEAGATASDPALGRLKFDALRWHAGKLAPKVYSDKQIHTGPDGESPVGFVLYGERESADGDTWQAQHRPK